MNNAATRIEEISRERRALNTLHALCDNDQKQVSDLLWGLVDAMNTAKQRAEEAAIEAAFSAPLPLATFVDGIVK